MKNIIIAVIILRGVLATTQAVAQPLDASRPEYLLQVAEEKFEAKDYYNALTFYDKYYDQTKDRSVTFKMGMAYMGLRDYVKAEQSFFRSLQRDKQSGNESDPMARFYLGQMQKMNEKYDEAIIAFEEFIKGSKDAKATERAKTEMEGAKMAMRMKENLKMTVENLGNKINTPNNEYSPSVAGGTLYFAAMRDAKETVLNGKEGDYFTKIYAVFKKADGTWDTPNPIAGDVNGIGKHQGNVSFSPDGKVMYFTRFGVSNSEISESKIFYSVNKGSSFGAPNEVAGVNGNWIAKHPAMGDLYGKSVLFFSSNMPGSKGGYDIFYAERKDDGNFSAPVNAGDVINTEGDEETPFYRDGKLYFSSNGLVGIGGFDNFTTTWNGSVWSKPENMGKGYNSSTDDHYLTMDAGGNVFFTSNRGGGRSIKSKTCCDDIYAMYKPPVVVDLMVNAKDPSGKLLKDIKYELTDISRKGTPDTKTGETYASKLDLKRGYKVIATKIGYYPDTIEFNTNDIVETTTLKKTVNLRPLPVVIVSLRANTLTAGNPLNGVTYTLYEIGGKNDTRTMDIYTATLVREKSYMLVAGKQGYGPDTVKFDTRGIKETTEIEKTLNLKPRLITVKRNEGIKLNNIFYKYDKFEATPEHMDNWDLAQQSLDYLYNIMTKYPDMVIELSSHTDARGSDTYNMGLSQRRADGARKYLLGKGIAENRVQSKGYGESVLTNSCGNGVKCSEEEHLANRRTEFKILSGPTTIEITEQVPAVKN
jgi:peptidoglycan-associated lipoprotein